MNRKKLKRRALRALGRAVYHRAMGNYEGARIQYQRLWAVCGLLGAFGTMGQQGWFNTFVRG